MIKSRRLDAYLLEQGAFDSLKEAEVAIRLGQVRDSKSGQILDKPGMNVPKNLKILIRDSEKFVGRAGDKLESLLNVVNLDFSNSKALDVGSSTGGFTDCLLQYGVSEVASVDVGTHQLHEKLRKDSRVHVFEQTDIRHFDITRLKFKPDIITVDVSFISLKAIVRGLLQNFPKALFILLFKPQFETSRYLPKKRGVVSETDRQDALEEMLLFLKRLGLDLLMLQDSAVRGTKGNQETFLVMQASLPKHIFRTYDIRGHADKELPDECVEKIGRALGKKLVAQFGATPKLGVGRDERVSSPRIYSALTRGLISQGVEIFYLGCVTTPMTYFAHYHFDIDGILQITASHNPKDDNGMKMMLAKNTLFGEEISALGEMAAQETLISKSSERKASIQMPGVDLSTELRKKYLDYLAQQFQFKRKYKIVVDCGNGMAGSIARDVFTRVASDLEILFEEVDCRFPNHEADPTIPENLKLLRERVVQSKSDVGFAFDGDGDRLGVITAKGRILWGDEILMLLSELVLKRNPGSTIIGEVKCSEKLFRMIEAKGGKPLMYKTGHSLIKKRMKELGAPIAGEMSGHLFFADKYFGFDDATYAALRVLEVMDELDLQDLDAWINTYPSSFVTPEIRVSCEESEKQTLVDRCIDFFKKQKDAELHLIDGIRVTFKDGSWALVRASNTQAVLVVRIEARSEVRLEEIRKIVSSALGKEIHV
ncbi:MAG: TlyA family rRNA (cytidine-2'-O)-methyltransferase [Deltaproteobacteria bacterium]|nr:TlyA family rRNA (cytidine-2'-O)-methyltransferase [Deltaproteobacteria bacterium]